MSFGDNLVRCHFFFWLSDDQSSFISVFLTQLDLFYSFKSGLTQTQPHTAVLGDGVCSFTGWRVGKGLLLTLSAFCSPFEHPFLYPPSDSKPPSSYSLAPACPSGLFQGQKTWMGWTAPSSLQTHSLCCPEPSWQGFCLRRSLEQI